jgi:aminoglycoside/choline kinase family phosphotransferase
MSLEKFVKEKFGAHVKIEKMTGDASDRTFYRIKKENDSLVLMKYASPFKEEELSYINIWRFFNDLSLPIPQILDIHPDQGILVLSDLGDTLLQNFVLRLKEEKNRDAIVALYKKGVEIIVDLQLAGTPALDENCVPSKSSLDKERFLFELNFFYDHYIKCILRITLKNNEEKEIKSWFEKIAEEISNFGKVLCHRDFHSRNLIIFEGKLYMTDFQDAQLGPCTYDLASFLRDSYADHEEEFIDEMIEFYLCHTQKKATQKYHPDGKGKDSPLKQLFLADDQKNRERFRKEFNLTCVQRNIKAIGTFAYQSYVKKNPYYLQYIPLTLRHVKANLKKLNINIPALNLILEKPSPKA